MPSEDIKKLLSKENKDVEKATGPLARLWRQILQDIGMNTPWWDALMIRYLNDPRSNIPNNSRDRSSARGNLQKELKRPSMTLKVFIKALRFLNAKWIRLEVHIAWHNGRTTVNGVNLLTAADFDELDNDEESEESEEAEHKYVPTPEVSAKTPASTPHRYVPPVARDKKKGKNP